MANVVLHVVQEVLTHLYINLLNEMGQDFLGRQYSGRIWIHRDGFKNA